MTKKTGNIKGNYNHHHNGDNHTHRHGYHHDHHNHEDVKNIKFAFILNFSFTIIEVIGGLITGSVAILSDAVHDFGDSISLGLSWYFQKLSKKPVSQQYTYGYKRFSLLGAIINAVVLIVGSILILIHSIPALFNPGEPNTTGMIILAVFGVIVNGAAAYRVYRGSSINERVVSLHMLEDVFGWASVLIGSLIMYFTNATFIDPLLSIFISIFILYEVIKNIGVSMRIILQGSPSDIDMGLVEKSLLQIDFVESIHDFHIWSMDGQLNIGTVHVVLNKEVDMRKQHELKQLIGKSMLEHNIQHSTIEFELPDENCGFKNCC